MAVQYKNADVEVALPEGQAETQTPVSRRVQIQPAASQKLYDEYSVEVANGHILYDDVSAAANYAVHGVVTWEGKEFVIQAEPRIWNIVPAASHVAVVIEERR